MCQSVNLSWKIATQNVGCVFVDFWGENKNKFRLKFQSSLNVLAWSPRVDVINSILTGLNLIALSVALSNVGGQSHYQHRVMVLIKVTRSLHP